MSSNRYTFHTDFKFTNRSTKAKFVYEKYKQILHGKILDVGADQCSLKTHLGKNVEYKGIGLGNNPDLQIFDLEKEKISFPDNSFDCVLCLDVLEHLENIHEIFDELCRVSKRWVIVSLPNPWSGFMTFLQTQKYDRDRNIKFYGLPKEREFDRHKWFFSSSEAKDFVKYRAKKNSMGIIDLYVENSNNSGLFVPSNWRQKRLLSKIINARSLLFRNDVHFPDLYEGTSWWVLKKK